MSITIEIGFGNNIPLQSTTHFDYFAFALVIFASTILSIFPILFFLKKDYILLKTKNVYHLILMCLFGMIHIWGAFVNHDHFEVSRNIQKTSCSFWGFWFQYFLGFNPWFFILVLRHQSYLWVFSKMWQGLKTYPQFFCSKIVTGAIFVIPLFTICVFVSVWDGDKWDYESDRCSADMEWKVVLLVWIIFCLLTMMALNIWVKWIIQPSLYYEYDAMNSIVRFAIEVIIVNSMITMSGLLSYSIGRTIATSMIVILHLYSVFILTSRELYYALTNNACIASEFIRTHKNIILAAKEVDDILKDPRILEDFTDYCISKKPILTKDNDKKPIMISPRNLVNFYRQMLNWKLSYFSDVPKTSNQKFIGIYESFIVKESTSDCHLPSDIIRNIDNLAPILTERATQKQEDQEDQEVGKEVISKLERYFSFDKGSINIENVKPTQMIFDDAITWVLKQLGIHWGECYLKDDIFERDIYCLYVNKSLTDLGQTSLEQRLRQSKYLQVFELETDEGINFFEMQEMPLFASRSGGGGYRHFGLEEDTQIGSEQKFVILDDDDDDNK